MTGPDDPPGVDAEGDLEGRLARYIQDRLGNQGAPEPESLCADRPDLLPRLRALIERYEQLEA